VEVTGGQKNLDLLGIIGGFLRGICLSIIARERADERDVIRSPPIFAVEMITGTIKKIRMRIGRDAVRYFSATVRTADNLLDTPRFLTTPLRQRTTLDPIR